MTGLVSISFRNLTPGEIIDACRANGIDSVEWGGDVHVPFGNVTVAKEVKALADAAGVKCYSYGSYYRIAASPSEDFEGVLACADALGTDIIRVWAFNKGSAQVTEEEYAAAVRDAQRICDMAKDKFICLECHNNTLTDDYRAALRYFADVDRPNFKSYWQPNQYRTHAYNLEAAKALASLTKSVHVFSWEADDHLPLATHADRWAEYISILRPIVPDAPYMLEFMHDGRVESLPETARVLHEWLK